VILGTVSFVHKRILSAVKRLLISGIFTVLENLEAEVDISSAGETIRETKNFCHREYRFS
jgi:hypothetical protein